MIHTFDKSREYFRLVGQIYLSEDGMYKELPDDLSSAYIQVSAVYYLVLVSNSGEFKIEGYANPPAKDKTEKTGGPVIWGADTVYTEAGPGTTALTLSRDYNPYLDAATMAIADAAWASLLARNPKWYE